MSVSLCRAEGGVGTVPCQGRVVTMGRETWALGLTDVVSAPLSLQDWSNRRAERDESKQVMVSQGLSPHLSRVINPQFSGEHLAGVPGGPRKEKGLHCKVRVSASREQGLRAL